MINAWLDLPAAALFAVLIVFYGLSGALISWLCVRSPLRAKIQTMSGVVAPFFGAVSLLFALLTGFLASDVGDRNRQAWRAVHTESSAAMSVHTLSVASASDMAASRAALRDYLQSVVRDEWRAMAEDGASSKTDTALAALLRELSDPKIATEAGQAVHNALLSTVLRVRDARADRLALASDRTNDVKWATVLILGLLTQIALASVHLERPRAQVAAIALFSVAAVVALGLIALQEQPFDGALRISSAPLQEALKATAAP
ncbi:MAG: bestrophin-like domain [Rhizomicrobium sp.]